MNSVVCTLCKLPVNQNTGPELFGVLEVEDGLAGLAWLSWNASFVGDISIYLSRLKNYFLFQIWVIEIEEKSIFWTEFEIGKKIYFISQN